MVRAREKAHVSSDVGLWQHRDAAVVQVPGGLVQQGR